MTIRAPAVIAARNGVMSAEVRVVTVSFTPDEVSVLAVTWPRPGKCLAVVATSAERIPRRNAEPLSATTEGVCPYSRSYCPIGGLEAAEAAGTVSITGARLTSTPERRTWRPQVRALAVSVASDHVP